MLPGVDFVTCVRLLRSRVAVAPISTHTSSIVFGDFVALLGPSTLIYW